MVLQFVLVGPPIQKHEVGAATLMDPEESDSVMRRLRGIREPLGGNLLRRGHEIGGRARRSVGNPVGLDAPPLRLPQIEEAHRSRRIRFL